MWDPSHYSQGPSFDLLLKAGLQQSHSAEVWTSKSLGVLWLRDLVWTHYQVRAELLSGHEVKDTVLLEGLGYSDSLKFSQHSWKGIFSINTQNPIICTAMEIIKVL